MDLLGVVCNQYEYLKNIPLIYAGMMLAALGGLAVVLVAVFVSWGLWHQRGLNQQAAQEANSSAPIPVPVAKNHQGDFQVFQATELEIAGAGSYRRGIDLEGKLLIHGDLKHVVVRSKKAFITLDGNASDCEFSLGPGSTFDGEDLSHSNLYIRGEGTAKVRNLSMETGIHVEHFTVENAADGQISSKDLRVLGSLSPQVKLLKGTWQ